MDTFEDVSDTNEEKDDEPFDLDEILPSIGEFGKYQKLLVFGICLPACIPCGFCAFNQLFMADVPDDYWCRVPDLFSYSVEEKLNWSIPIIIDDNGDSVHSKCYRYAVNWREIIRNNDMSTFSPNSSWPTEYCRDGWEFDTTTVYSSIVIDYNLVCDDDILPTVGLAALNTGGPIGVFLFGLLNDRHGRRLAYFLCLATLLLGSFITAASPDFWTWAFSRVIVGLTIPAVYQIPFIIALELVGPNYRSFVTVMTCTFYCVGIILLSGVTYIVRDWVDLCLYTSVPFLTYFLYIFVMPESPRWLLMKGKLEQALKVLETMARVNGKQFPVTFKEKLEARVLLNRTQKKKKPKNVGVFDLCRTPNMRLKTILITLSWFANETVYLGLSYYGPALGSNQYFSFFLSAAVEIPSYLCCWFVMDRCGRKWPLSLSMILGGISCVFTVLLPDDAVNETLILYLISKALLSASFLIIYPFAGELYPTEVRGIGIGISSYIGGLGLIVIPFITYLGKENLRLPLVIMGCVSVLGGLTGLRLPETLNAKLPQTLEDGEIFGADWKFEDCFKCAPKRSESFNSTTYENLDSLDGSGTDFITEFNKGIEQPLNEPPVTENTAFASRPRRTSMKRLVRQQSIMDTQKTQDGTMQLTYWF
ncbi:carcinine transporter [Condylostylus longicornis]|uniref:carcinine transporter n=1 Tax=Condylostylus longicornis TaxID=2530218 RepID=UPI00244E29F2|nr:carcinine transporter [Condylostylus longicornis]